MPSETKGFFLSEEMELGWIKLHRKILDSVVYQDSHLLQLWVYILLKVNSRPKKFLFNQKEMILEPGQGIFGLNQIVKDLTKLRDEDRANFKKFKTTYYRRLKLLEKLGKVKLQPTNQFTIITVTYWQQYQQSETPVKLQRNSSETPVKTNKKYKNEKKGENEKNKNTVAENHGNGIEIPENLNNPSFQSAWSDWNQYRREIRKPLKPMSMKQQLKFLAEQPDPVACINQSITNQWQGLFEIKHLNNGNGHYKPEQHARQRVLDNVRAVEELIANVSKRN